MIEDQVRRWELSRRRPEVEHRRGPIITVSRLPGCYGRILAQELARRLKFDLFDKELLHRVAESSHLSESILNTIDEKNRPMITEWVESLFRERYLSGEYFHHLSKVLLAIAEHGRAVILGRGASWILKPQSCLRVLLVAPIEARVRIVASREGMPREEARRRVTQEESDRRAFIRRHFHADMLDPMHYDLVLNTGSLGHEAVLGAIQAAWEGIRMKPPAGVK